MELDLGWVHHSTDDLTACCSAGFITYKTGIFVPPTRGFSEMIMMCCWCYKMELSFGIGNSCLEFFSWPSFLVLLTRSRASNEFLWFSHSPPSSSGVSAEGCPLSSPVRPGSWTISFCACRFEPFWAFLTPMLSAVVELTFPRCLRSALHVSAVCNWSHLAAPSGGVILLCFLKKLRNQPRGVERTIDLRVRLRLSP